MSAVSTIHIRTALAAVLASPGFRRSERMSRFLRHVVENALSGDDGQLKETSIGVAVFDRPPSYDPKQDPVVRNEARRLRAKLEQFYSGPGSSEPVRIEIPKGGYAPRFERVEPPVFESKRINIRWWLAAAALGVAAAAVSLYRPQPSAVAWHLSPLTTSPGRELQPSISPDGNRVAFASDERGNYDIYVRDPSGRQTRITAHPSDDLHPAWSPDGASLAFLRVNGARFDVVVLALATGVERRVGQLRELDFGSPTDDATQMFGLPGPTWSPDGRFLAVTDRTGSGAPIHLIAVDTGAVRAISSPPPRLHDLDPAFSPDGRTLAFCRWHTNSASDIYTVPVEGGAEKRITREPADFRGIGWMPNGRDLIVSSNRAGLYSLFHLSLADGALRAAAPSSGSAREPSVSRDGSRIVYTDYRLESQIWRIPLGRRGEPELVLPSTRQDHSVRLSPDGKKLAFVSDRSGAWEIWIADRDGRNSRQVTRFGGPLAGSVGWSPDSRSIAFDARPRGHSAIYLATEPEWEVRRWAENAFEEKMPSWSADGRWLYFNSGRQGSQQLWKAPVAGGEAVLVSAVFAADSAESPDGKSVYFGGRGPGLYRIDPLRGEPERIPTLATVDPKRLWTVDRRGLWLVDPSRSPISLLLLDPAGQLRKMAELPKDIVLSTPGLSISPEGAFAYFARRKESESDLMMLTTSP
jgi:Tol biopolymer transport system component